MQIRKVKRTEKAIEFKVEKEGGTFEEVSTLTFHEAPKASFEKAMDALTSTVAGILNVSPEWALEATVDFVSISHREEGRSVRLHITREIAGKTWGILSPAYDLDSGEELSSPDTARITKFLHEAEKYLEGDRQQALLPLDAPQAKGVEPEEGENLPLIPEEPESNSFG